MSTAEHHAERPAVGRPRDGDFCPQLRHVASSWVVDGDGGLRREVTAIEEPETMPAPKSTPQIQEVAPTRKKRRAKVENTDGSKVVNIRTTRAQAAAVDGGATDTL